MKSLLMALSLALIFSSCASKKKTDMLGSEAAIAYPPNPDSATSRAMPTGADRMVVVETINPDGSRTTTTTTEANKKRIAVPTSRPVARPATVKSEPVASTVATPTAAEKKAGWSNRAKGAVIGGVGGAAAGALISKKKVEGAVIGGVAGAAGGYIIGNEVDRTKAKQ
jgi:hypothetical protein